VRKNKVFLADVFCFAAVGSYTFFRDKDLAGGEAGWRQGGPRTARLPAIDVFRK